jgi:hypothetical protein
MKFQLGTRHLDDVFAQLIRWMPSRRAELEVIRGKCVLGVSIDITPLRSRHTEPQRAAYWSALHRFGDALGYSAAESEMLLHNVVLAEAFGTRGTREIRTRGKQYAWPVPAERSSKDAEGRARDRETYSALIETLLRLAAEYGVVLEIGDAA